MSADLNTSVQSLLTTANDTMHVYPNDAYVVRISTSSRLYANELQITFEMIVGSMQIIEVLKNTCDFLIGTTFSSESKAPNCELCQGVITPSSGPPTKTSRFNLKKFVFHEVLKELYSGTDSLFSCARNLLYKR